MHQEHQAGVAQFTGVDQRGVRRQAGVLGALLQVHLRAGTREIGHIVIKHGVEHAIPVPARGQLRGLHEQIALVAGVADGLRHGGHSQTRQRPCGIPDALAVRMAHPVPLGHTRQVDTANGRLDLGEAPVGAEALVAYTEEAEYSAAKLRHAVHPGQFVTA